MTDDELFELIKRKRMMSEQEHGIGANLPPDPVIVAKNSRIAELEAELARLRGVLKES